MSESSEGGINIQLTADVGKGRSLVFLTHIERDANAAWINTMLDKLNGCADRAQAKYELEALEFQLANELRTLGEMKVAKQNIDTRHQADWIARGRKGAYKPDAKEVQEKVNADSTITRLEQMIGVIKERIENHKAKIGEVKAA